MSIDGVDFGSEMRRFVADLERRSPELAASARVQRAWNAVAVPEIAAHTNAVYVVPGTAESEVIVYVDTQIIATELGLQSELLRLKLNVELHAMLEAEGKLPARRGDALFDLDDAEHVKRLVFVPSKERYTSRYARARDEDLPAAAHIEPLSLSDDELAELEAATAGIKDDALRSAALAAARAHFELEKGRRAAEAMKSNESS